MTTKRITSHTEALAHALKAAGLEPTDQAAYRLAIEYANQLDAGVDISKVGRHYLDVLGALGLTPAARVALAKLVPKTSAAGADDLTRLRERKRRTE